MNSIQKLYLSVLIPGLVAGIIAVAILWSPLIFVGVFAFLMLLTIDFAVYGDRYFKWMIEEMKREEVIQEEW